MVKCIQKTAALLLLVTLNLLLSSCGYHLRGTSQNDIELSNIDFSIESALTENKMERIVARRWALLVSGNSRVADSQRSQWKIRLLQETTHSRGVMRGLDGRANQYEITLKLDYQWLSGAEHQRAPETMQITRSYYQPSQDLVGNQAQKETLLRQMREELSDRLLHQLASLASQAQTTISSGQ